MNEASRFHFRAWGYGKMHNGCGVVWGCVANDLRGIYDQHDRYETLMAKDLVVMQSTGLVDKTGKEIFEGDILDMCYWCNGDSEAWMACVEWGILEDSDGYRARGYACWKTGNSSLLDTAPLSEIIGNIYENPELDKKEGE